MDFLLSIQRALLGRVTPNLRAVTIDTKNNEIILYFYYDKPPSEDEQEMSSLADTDFISDFPAWPEAKTDCKVITLAYPEKIPSADLYAYHRFEGNYY